MNKNTKGTVAVAVVLILIIAFLMVAPVLGAWGMWVLLAPTTFWQTVATLFIALVLMCLIGMFTVPVAVIIALEVMDW